MKIEWNAVRRRITWEGRRNEQEWSQYCDNQRYKLLHALLKVWIIQSDIDAHCPSIVVTRLKLHLVVVTPSSLSSSSLPSQCALPRHFWNWNHSRQKRIEGESAKLLTAADTIVTPCSSTTSTVLHVCLISITRHFEEDDRGKKGQQFFLSQWHFPSRAQGREAHVNSLTRRIDWKSHHCEFKTQRRRQVTQRGWRRFFLPFLLIFSTRNATLDQSKYSTDSSSPRVCTFIAASSSLLSYPIPPSPWQCLKFRTSLHHVRTLATSSLFLFHVCSCSLVFSFGSFLSLFNHHF